MPRIHRSRPIRPAQSSGNSRAAMLTNRVPTARHDGAMRFAYCALRGRLKQRLVWIKKTSVVKAMDCRVEPGNDEGELRRFARDPSLIERRHAGVTGERGAQQKDRDGGAEALAQSHVQVEERRKFQFLEQHAMAGLDGNMPREGVPQSIGVELCKRGDRRSRDKAVEDDRNAFAPRGKRGPQNGGKLTPTQSRSDCEWIMQRIGVARQRAIDNGLLARKTVCVDAGAASRPALCAAAKQASRDRRRRGGIADAHFTEAHEIALR